MALAYLGSKKVDAVALMGSASPSPPQRILTQDELKKIAAYKAVEFVESGMVLGLGTGSTAKHAIDRIGELLRQGKLANIIGIPTSTQTHEQALSLGIPLSDLDAHPVLDLAIDGADEVDPDMNLVKGRGGSLLREKMIEGCCKKFVVIVDESKLVDYIGGSGLAMPVEIVPFCWKFTAQKLQSLFEDAGCVAKLRLSPENAFNNGGDRGFNPEEKEDHTHIKRSDFPPGFLFGAATSAYQVEGAYLEDAKSLSNWDVFCHSVEGCGENGENGDIAVDHYHQFLEDIEIMHSLGLKAYRFSISWARILPRGRFGEVNPAGIMFYNQIIDNLILKGIEPFVTIFHNDFPQELEERYGSWLNPEMKEEFVHMAEICFKSFGDRVKYWITINEPNIFTEYAYERGLFPPSRCSKPFGNCSDGNSDVEPLVVMHNLLLAHGRAAKLYHEKFQSKQGGSIGLVMHCYMSEPLTDSELDRNAATRALAFSIGWSLDPVIFGEYPKELHEYLGSLLPSFSLDEKNFLKNSTDFIGINHYSTAYAKDCTNSSCSPMADRAIRGFLDMVGERDGVPIGEPTRVEGLTVVPRGMGEIVDYIKIRYHNKPMFITENGYSSPDVHEDRIDELVNDIKRVEFHATYLASLAESVRGGADVRGYFVWSLMDNYEWLHGYDVKFGLYYIDRKTLTRVPKLSAKWYKNFLRNNSDVISKGGQDTEDRFKRVLRY